MENYIVINGKKAELTKEQLEKLGIKPERNNPFNRVNEEENYFIVREDGTASSRIETFKNSDDWHYYDVAYFNDKEFAEQMSLKWLLNRKLERYAWDNEAEDVKWDKNRANSHYCIHYLMSEQRFVVYEYGDGKVTGAVYFSNRYVAEDAIENVIKPFMKEHPNFKW